MTRSELVRFARTGAEARLQSLEAEIQSILRMFPDLRRRGSYRSNGAGPRRGRRMSAAERKAVSIRMKKYWAARRKAKR
jgi:hypothetical protein